MKNLLVIIKIVLFLIPAEILYAQRDDVKAIAILREDGILVPFAHYLNEDWHSLEENEISRVARHQPDWYLKISPDSTMILQTGTEVIYDPEGQNRGRGMVSSYPATEFGRNSVFPKEKVGIAFSWDQPHSHFMVPKNDSIKQELRTMMEHLLNEEELQVIEQSRFSYEIDGRTYYHGIPGDKAARDTASVAVLMLVTDRKIKNTHIYYLTAFKNYRSESNCTTPMLNGWITETDGVYQFFKLAFGVGDCDGKMLPPFVNPRVAFEYVGRRWVAADVNYYEGEDYFLFEVKDGEVSSVLKTFY